MPGCPRDRRNLEPRLVAGPAECQCPAPEPGSSRPDGRGLRLRRRVQGPRPRRGEARHRGCDDVVAGLVAGRLGPLRAALHPDGLAQRGHLPDQRRPRRRRGGRAALRPPEQLARQRQPRQGTPAAVAGEEEVRPRALLGRPDGARGQLRAGVDGLHHVRLRRWPRGRLGAPAHQLGQRGHLARRRPLQRRARPREPAGRRPDGPDLRQPGGPQRRPERARRGQGHPGDVRPHGDERRGDGRADRRRTHVRQDPRCGRRRERRPRARGRPAAADGPGLDEQLRHRQGRRRHHQRPGGRLDAHADHLGQQLLRARCSATTGTWSRARPVRGSGSRPTPPRRTPCPTRTIRPSGVPR